VETIQKIGAEKIKKLNLLLNGIPIVSDKKDGILWQISKINTSKLFYYDPLINSRKNQVPLRNK